MAADDGPFLDCQTDCRMDCTAHSDKSDDFVRMIASLANILVNRTHCLPYPAIGFSVCSESVMEGMPNDGVAGTASTPWSFLLRTSQLLR